MTKRMYDNVDESNTEDWVGGVSQAKFLEPRHHREPVAPNYSAMAKLFEVAGPLNIIQFATEFRIEVRRCYGIES